MSKVRKVTFSLTLDIGHWTSDQVYDGKEVYPDKWLFAATVGLALFGVVMVYSASAVIAERENGTQFYYVSSRDLDGDWFCSDACRHAV